MKMDKYRASHHIRSLIPTAVCSVLLIFIIFGSLQCLGQERLRLATTTSVQDSGLLPYLLPHFEKLCGCKVDVIAVGTGQALKIASNGDVDMVLVHDPISEKKFMDGALETSKNRQPWLILTLNFYCFSLPFSWFASWTPSTNVIFVTACICRASPPAVRMRRRGASVPGSGFPSMSQMRKACGLRP